MRIPTVTHPVLYRHYKGGLYELVCMAKLEENLTDLVIYKCANGVVWARPAHVFHEKIEVDGKLVPRFALVAPEVAP